MAGVVVKEMAHAAGQGLRLSSSRYLFRRWIPPAAAAFSSSSRSSSGNSSSTRSGGRRRRRDSSGLLAPTHVGLRASYLPRGQESLRGLGGFDALPRGMLALSFSAMPAADEVLLTKSCAQRIALLREQKDCPNLRLRLSVEGGGCSGFSYNFEMDTEDVDPEEDSVFARDGAEVVVDETSLEFVKGATLDFTQDMMRSAFVVLNNPNSESACGCGSSFAIKNFEANPARD